MAWKVYILECRNGALYTGSTTDLERRLKEHRAGGAKYTRSNPPVRVVFTQNFRSRSAAQKKEARIKALSRAQKLDLISRNRPKSLDLS